MRVLRHIGFVDLSGFTTLTDRDGDEVAVGVVTTFRSLVRAVCSRRGVRVAKWLGDGAMLVTVEPSPLLGALLELSRAVGVAGLPVPVRAGAVSGEVILVEGDDYIGQPVNLAARLCDMAPGGDVLAAPDLAAHRPRWAEARPSGELAVRGLERAVAAVHLGFAPLTPPVVPDPVCGIPLSRETSEERLFDRLGQEVWFCAASCRETWEHRPQPVAEGQGSLRTPFIGT